MLALFLQEGLDYSALRSGLTVTPFALGWPPPRSSPAGWAPVRALAHGLRADRGGGRLIATALVLRHTTGDAAQWAILGPLLVAGLGGDLTQHDADLQHVPVEMAGAAGGAVQTVQRIGAAIGTTTLVTIFYHVLLRTGHDYPTAVSDALLAASGFMLLALLMALADLMRRPHRPERPAPHERPEQHPYHM